MLGDASFDLGYASGAIVGAVVTAWLLAFAWGAFRAEDNKLRRGREWAFHWRTLSVAGFLWLASALGRLGSS